MMQTQGRRKRGPQLSTLTPLLRHFIGLELRVELKTGRSYFGFLDDSDDDMNLTLSSVPTCETAESSCHRGDERMTKEDPTGSREEGENDMGIFNFSKLHIRGSSIRYVQFPDNADLPAMIRIGLDRKRAAEAKYSRGKRQK